MNVQIEPSWNTILADYIKTNSFEKLYEFVTHEYKNKVIYPREKDLFAAFKSTPFNKVKVVIIGQDPYHNPGQAHGLCFSVQNNVVLPPSLKNIYKEIESDLGITKNSSNGNLQDWAEQGVFLLNAILSVEEHKPGSHSNKGWEEFTDHVIQKISDQCERVVFLLWGKYAQKKGSIIDRSKHLVLETSHPSPLGAYRGFIECKHFSQTNKYLKEYHKTEIDW